MIKVILFIAGICFANFACAQTVNKNHSAQRNIAALAVELSKDLQNDKEIASAFFEWIIQHIDYDYKALRKNKYAHLQTANTVLSRKKAVCYGYSQLFKALCKEVGIETVTVIGYTKNPEHERGDPYYIAEHAWNAVRLADKWHLLDATFGSGYLGPKKQGFRRWLFQHFGIPFHVKQKFYRKPDPFYFLPTPDTLVYTHLAANPTWQLIECPVPIKNFENITSTVDITDFLTEKDSSKKDFCLPVKKNAEVYSSMNAASKQLNDGKNGLQYNQRNHRIARDGYYAYALELTEQQVTWNADKPEYAIQQLQKRLDYYQQVTTHALAFQRDIVKMQQDYRKKVVSRNQLLIRNNAPLMAKNQRLKEGIPYTIKKIERAIDKTDKAVVGIYTKAAKMSESDLSKVRRRRQTDSVRIAYNDSIIIQHQLQINLLQFSIDSLTTLIQTEDKHITANLDSVKHLYVSNSHTFRINTAVNINTHLVLNDNLPVLQNYVQAINQRLQAHQQLIRKNALIENRKITKLNQERYKKQLKIVSLLIKNRALVTANKSYSAVENGESQRFSAINKDLLQAQSDIAQQFTEKSTRLSERVSFLRAERSLVKHQIKVLRHEMNYENYRLKKAETYIQTRFSTLTNRNLEIIKICREQSKKLDGRIKFFYRRAKAANPEFKSKK